MIISRKWKNRQKKKQTKQCKHTYRHLHLYVLDNVKVTCAAEARHCFLYLSVCLWVVIGITVSDFMVFAEKNISVTVRMTSVTSGLSDRSRSWSLSPMDNWTTRLRIAKFREKVRGQKVLEECEANVPKTERCNTYTVRFVALWHCDRLTVADFTKVWAFDDISVVLLKHRSN